MTLTEIITPSRIRTGVALEEAGEAIPMLTGLIANDLNMDSESLNEALLDREKLGSTAIGKGVALPHAKCAAVAQPVGAMLLLKEPVSYATPDDIPLDIFIALLVPADDNDLAVLAQLAKALREDTLLRDFRAAENPAEAHAGLERQLAGQKRE